MKNSKKGFTLVELLVVIAILAILATVAVVGYTSFTRKAEISNDSVIAKELTTLIQATDINDPVEEFDDVMDVLYANGFYLTNLNTKTDGCFFVWESKNNQILLVDAKNGFEVLFPENYEPAGATWHLVCADKDLLEGLTLPEGVVVKKAVATLESLQEFIAEGGEIYLDESIVLNAENVISIANKDAHVKINLGESSISAGNEVLPTAPIRVTTGSLTLNGGSISGAGQYTNENGTFKATIQTGSSDSANTSVVNITGTTITNNNADVERGSTIRVYRTELNLSNVTLNAAKMCVYVSNASNAVLDNVTATATGDAVIFVTHYAASGISLEGLKTTATINSGVYTNKAPASNTNTSSVITVMNGGEVEINGGTFISENGNVFYFSNGGTVTINGGTFSQNPEGLANVVVNGTVTDNGNGTWTVTK